MVDTNSSVPVPKPGVVHSSGIIIPTPAETRAAVSQAFRDAHDRSDVDSDRLALHHTLGNGPLQAAPGNHDHDGVIESGAYSNFAGPWSNVAPANPTQGLPFVIYKPGTYLVNADVSGYVGTAPTLQGFQLYIDGVLITGKDYYFNTNADHREIGIASGRVYLTAGTHYFYIRGSAGLASDANERGTFTWTRAGDQSSFLANEVAPSYDSGWIDVASNIGFQNGWVNYDARTVRIRKLNGVVFIDGIAKNGVVNTTIFTLPPGFRPRITAVLNELILPVISNAALGSLTITGSQGAVLLNVGSNVYLSFSGVSFIAEN